MLRISDLFEQRDNVYVQEDHDHWLRKHVILPYEHHSTYARGILFFGPSGNGKTTTVHHFAKQLGMNVMSFACQEFIQQYCSQVSTRLYQLFVEAAEFRSLLYFDGVDALVGRKDSGLSLANTFKSVMQQFPDVMVIGTTNNLDLIDPSVRCHGQFSHEIHFDYPQLEERVKFLNHLLRHHAEVDVDVVAERTDKYTLADLKHVVDMAVINQLVDADKHLQTYHFEFKPPIVTDSSLDIPKANVLYIGPKVFKKMMALQHQLYSSYNVESFPVLQQHYKYYFVHRLGQHNMYDLLAFLEWASINNKIVIASNFTNTVAPPIVVFFK